jgi:hypothetical protein
LLIPQDLLEELVLGHFTVLSYANSGLRGRFWLWILYVGGA